MLSATTLGMMTVSQSKGWALTFPITAGVNQLAGTAQRIQAVGRTSNLLRVFRCETQGRNRANSCLCGPAFEGDHLLRLGKLPFACCGRSRCAFGGHYLGRRRGTMSAEREAEWMDRTGSVSP